MELTSQLPVSLMFFKHWHTDGTEVGIVIAKSLFKRHESGNFRAVSPPPELIYEDQFEDDAPEVTGSAPLIQEQDIAPGKIGTDVIVFATARAPNGEQAADWPVNVSIADRLSYGFQVRGPSQWTHSRFKWKCSDPEAVLEVPLSYRLAYGGSAEGAKGLEIYEYNPCGIGLVTPERLQKKEPIEAPQIGDLAEFIANKPDDVMTVHGFAPLAKAWLPRRVEAGTFDEAWQQTRHPRMPPDYSLSFWNAAPKPMQVSPALIGNEEIVLQGMSHVPEPIKISLPGVSLVVRMQTENEEQFQDMVLDTVTLDVRDPDPLNHTMVLIWHVIVSDPNQYLTGDVESMRVEL